MCAVGIVGFVRVPFACAVGWVRSIPVRLGGRRVCSCAFGRFPCALRVVGYIRGLRPIPAHPWGLPLRSVAFGTFRYVLEVVGSFGSTPVRTVGRRVRRLAHSHAHWVSKGARVPWGRPVRWCLSRASLVTSGSLVSVRSVHSCAPWWSSDSFACVRPFPFALGIFGFVRVRSVHYRSPWGSFGLFPSALCYVSVRTVDTRTPWR